MTPPEPELSRQNYVRSTARSLWDNLPLVILASLVFSLAATPAFLTLHTNHLFAAIAIATLTVAPGWAALMALEAGILSDVRTDIRAMLAAFSRYWSRSVRLGLLVAAPLTLFLLALPALGRPQTPPAAWLILAVTTFCFFLALVLCLYAYPLLVLHNLEPGIALRNAYLLAIRHTGDTAGLLSMGVLFGLAVIYISPGLLLFLPAIWGLFVLNYCRVVVAEALTGAQK